MRIASIKGYEEVYEVTDDGKVFSCERKVRNGKGLRTLKRKELKRQLSRYKRYTVNLWKNRKPTVHLCSRLVAKAFIPNPQNKPEVNHKNGIKTNDNYWNLEWTTSSENKIHAFKIGLKNQKGEKNNAAKLTQRIALEIREKYATGKYTYEKLVKEYATSKSNIAAIVQERNWKQI